jgi:type II secretory pathway pseudopilin PulG
MKTIKLRNHNGYTLIEVIIVLMISFSTLVIILPIVFFSSLHVIDATIFSSMMRAIHTNQPQDIVIDQQVINTYYPNHSFSRSYVYKLDSFRITFYIGRGYYAIKKSP